MTSLYSTAFGSAQSAWDATSAPGYFDYQPSASDPMINVYDGSYTWASWAITSYSCIPVVQHFYSNEVSISMNTSTMGGLTAYQKKLVMEHELGHAYGLAHVTPTCTSSGRAVMSKGETKFGCGGTPPWTDDVNGATAVNS